MVRSVIGRLPVHRRTVRALGLRKIGSSVELAGTPSIRGMVRQVGYLLKVESVEAANTEAKNEVV